MGHFSQHLSQHRLSPHSVAMVDWQPRRGLGAHCLRIRHLPSSSYATFAPGSASRLRDLLWDSLRVATHNVRTKPRWHSEDWHWAFAFLETMTELDGTRLIHTIHTSIVQAVPLRAEWTHDSGPALARDSVIVRVGLPELDLLCFQHPLYGAWRVAQGGAMLPRHRWPPLGHPDPHLSRHQPNLTTTLPHPPPSHSTCPNPTATAATTATVRGHTTHPPPNLPPAVPPTPPRLPPRPHPQHPCPPSYPSRLPTPTPLPSRATLRPHPLAPAPPRLTPTAPPPPPHCPSLLPPATPPPHAPLHPPHSSLRTQEPLLHPCPSQPD